MCGMFDLDVWDSAARYIVLDDFDFEFFPGMRKALWGAQKQFTVNDKFKRKRSVVWGKPLIWCCNEAGSPFEALDKRGNYLLKGSEREWFQDNCVEITITEKMY